MVWESNRKILNASNRQDFNEVVREAAKKKVPPLVAGPLRGGEGGKGRATKVKRTFFKTFFKTFFFILLPFKNKNYFTFDNLSKYGHITLKFVGRYFYLVVTIFSKK